MGKAVIRLNGLVIPLIIQPLFFYFRNSFWCTCRWNGLDIPASKTASEEVIADCKCKGDETCEICEDNLEMSEMPTILEGKEEKVGKTEETSLAEEANVASPTKDNDNESRRTSESTPFSKALA